jgi:plastocyanin
MWKQILLFTVVFLLGCSSSVDVIVGPADQSPAEKPVVEPEIVEKPVEQTQDPANDTKVNDSNIITGEASAELVPSKIIIIQDDGFNPKTITVNQGERVIWRNERTENLYPRRALVVGTRLCRQLRSHTMGPGEFFEHTFEEVGSCNYADAIYTKQGGTVLVE